MSAVKTPSPGDLRSLLADLPAIHEAVQRCKATLLANLAMVSEIPAPTFGEEARTRFLQDRFNELDLKNCSIDEVGNCVGVISGKAPSPGSGTPGGTLLVAHTDTSFSKKDDHTVTVQADRVVGAGVCDNSLGVAVLATLPTLLDELGIALNRDVILMGSVRSLGRGDLAGLRFFLENSRVPLSHGICVEGVQLGRLSYTAIGMLRGEITVDVPETYDWTRFDAAGAVEIITEVVQQIQHIPLPMKPRTTVLFGTLTAGSTFDTTPTRAALRFEIRSESQDVLEGVHQSVRQIVDELSAKTRAGITMEVVAQREPGGVTFGHPLVQTAREVMQSLDLEPRISPSISELASFIAQGIPAVTLGISSGENIDMPDESVDIDPMFTGITQLLATLLAIDGGLCDED